MIELKHVAVCMNTRVKVNTEAAGQRLHVQCKRLDNMINMISIIRFCDE